MRYIKSRLYYYTSESKDESSPIMMRLLLCSLFLVQCCALSVDELQQLMKENCGLGTPHAGKLLFSCPFGGGAFTKENVKEVLEGNSIIQLNDFVFDREFKLAEGILIDYKHSFSVSSNEIELVNRDEFQGLVFSSPKNDFPTIDPPPPPSMGTENVIPV